MMPKRFFILALFAVALVVAALLGWHWRTSPAASQSSAAVQPVAARHVGSAACRGCHAAAYEAWQGSHHALAMQEANDQTVLGDFADARFRQHGIESTFFRRGERFMVRTEGADGKLADFEIRYTFGVFPLQQYLVAFPGGRYQALQIAWDSRPKERGGQRWFHLQPEEKISPQDPLHWTGHYQNWAMQCAECHSTDLRKGYDAANHRYQTTFAEINVGCEACHGPGSKHVDWAEQAKPPYASDADKGLPGLKTDWQTAWKMPAEGAKVAVRDRPAEPAGMNSCAACHARRSTLSEARQPGAPLGDSHRLAMLTLPNYHVDGQQREEVYVWGSFLQSKMYQRGVTCMDCHEPHGQKLRAEGNALCTRCHAPAEFDQPAHHHHPAGGPGAACVNCHMPTQNYMVVHGRQDHSLRLPRPDLSASLGTPNACNQCHQNRPPTWAAAALDQWFGTAWRQRPHYGTVLHAGQTRGAAALPDLLALARDPAMPAIVRATATTLAQPMAQPGTLESARALLRDPDPLVREAALGLLDKFDQATRIHAAAGLLADPVRSVRIEAARLLADVPAGQLPADRQLARQAALLEYEAALALDADWPSANLNLGNLRLRQGRPDEAMAAFEQAIALDRRFSAGYINLADVLRQQGREADAAQVLRDGIAALPADADLQHALGFSLTRQGDKAAALKAFAKAARLNPANARYAYVQAIALNSEGKPGEALAVLQAANRRHPQDLDILSALISISRERGDTAAALRYARQAASVLPDNPELARLLAQLEGR